MTLPLEFRVDDLKGEQTRVLIARHLAGMHANSAPESVHALDIDKLRSPDVTFWSVWVGDTIAGCGALKRLDARRGELRCARFEGYSEDPFSVFMTRSISGASS